MLGFSGKVRKFNFVEFDAESADQGWKPITKPKPENPVLKGILETQTETDTYLAKFLKT